MLLEPKPRWVKQFADSVSQEFAEVLADPEYLIATGDIIKDDKSTTVVRFGWQGQHYIIKRFNARNKGHSVKRALRQTRARNCWNMSEIFLQSGIQVATPIAMLEKKIGFVQFDSYFVTTQLNGEELLHWLPRQAESEQSLVSHQIQQLFKTFAANRLTHGDMKATNLLWCDQQIVMIDLDAAKQHSSAVLFARAHARDKRRFCRNGQLFADMLAVNES